MAAALAIFLLFAVTSALFLLVLVLAARAFRHHRGSRYRVPSLDQLRLPRRRQRHDTAARQARRHAVLSARQP
jgi:hypothetical protein